MPQLTVSCQIQGVTLQDDHHWQHMLCRRSQAARTLRPSPCIIRSCGVLTAIIPLTRSDIVAASAVEVLHGGPSEGQPMWVDGRGGRHGQGIGVPMLELTAQLDTSSPPARVLTVAELTSRLNSDGQTALMRIRRSSAASISVVQLLRREGRSLEPSRTRHAAAPRQPSEVHRSRASAAAPPVRGTAALAVPPARHHTRRTASRRISTPSRGIGPMAAVAEQPFAS
jgi:hypothetical protein